jgi:dipeptidyl aminopeptidase/acylaminoacyl peptidase
MVMDVECAFAKKALNIRVVFDGHLLVQGLFFTPAWNPPPGLDPKAFTERAVTVGSKALPLSGTLTLPAGKGPFPGLVLVHGSGPNDADESLGPNKLFKELAWGLASRGVVVLRYHKRTFQHRGKVEVPTVKEETIDDALSAVAELARTKEVAAGRIFLAGHSMGAWLGPRIAAADERIQGVIMLAASSRPQWHLVVEQLEYMQSLDGTPKPELDAALSNARVGARTWWLPSPRPNGG